MKKTTSLSSTSGIISAAKRSDGIVSKFIDRLWGIRIFHQLFCMLVLQMNFWGKLGFQCVKIQFLKRGRGRRRDGTDNTRGTSNFN